MEPLTDRDLRDLVFGLAAVELGHAKTQDVGVALQKALGESSTDERSVWEALVETAGLEGGQIAEIERAAEKRLADASGDVQAALEQTGGLLRAVQAQFAKTLVGDTVRLGLEPVEEATRDRLRETPPGRYVDFERVGAGGMGIVYLALDSDLNREVAFKIVNPRAFEANPPTARTPSQLSPPDEDTPASKAFATLKARFLQEALITGHLSHPSIVPVYEVGQTPGGVPYYTMKFVRGERTFGDEIAAAETLEDRLGLLESFLDLCDAVAYAHEQGVVHRDLKPGNVQRGSFGETVLLDWGLARTKGVEDEAADDRWRQRIAELRGDTGLKTIGVLGTPGYMAPEALQGDPSAIDAHSDQYSLGVILFQVLTGRLPHELDTSGDLAAAFSAYRRLVQSEDAPRADAVNPAVPRELADLCARVLARVPQGRLGSVAELAESIRVWQRESARRQQRAERRTAIARTALYGSLVFLAVVAALLWRTDILRRRAKHSEARAVTSEAQARKRSEQLAERKRELDRRLDDAYWEAYRKFAERGEAAGRLLVACAAIENARDNNIDSPRCWRFLADDALKNCPRLIATSPGPNTWLSPEGTLLAYYGPEDGRIRVVDLMTGQVKAVLPVDDSESAPSLRFGRGEAIVVLWSGKWFRENARMGEPWEWEGTVTLWDVRTGTSKERIEVGEGFGRPVLSPDRTTLASAGRGERAGTVALWSLATGEQKGTLRGHPSEVSRLDFTPDGATLVAGSEDGTVKVWDVTTCGEQGTVRVTAGLAKLAVSPDGKSIVSLSADPGGIKIWDVADAEERFELPVENVEKHPESEWFYPEGEWFFAPDGSTLVVLAIPGDYRWAMPGDDRSFYSRASVRPQRARLWDVATGRQKAVVEFPVPRYAGPQAFGHALSPDQTTLAVQLSDQTMGLWDTATGRQKGQLTGVGQHCRGSAFSPDGEALAVGNRDGTIKLWDVAVTRPIVVCRGHRAPVFSLVFSLDGTTLTSRAADGTSRVWDVRVGRELSPEDPVPHLCRLGYSRSVFTPTADTLVCDFSLSGRGTHVRLFAFHDIASGRVRALGRGRRLCLSPDGSILALAAGDDIVLRDVSTGRRLASLAGEGGRSWQAGAVFSPDGGKLVSFGRAHERVKLWDPKTGQLLLAIGPGRVGARSPSHAAFSPDGKILVWFGARDGTLGLWDVEAATPRGKGMLRGHTEAVSSVTFSPDSNLLGSVGGDQSRQVRLWDVRSGRELATFDDGSSIAFSPDGRRFALARGNPLPRWNQIELWNVSPLRQVQTTDGHCVGFSPDGTILAVAHDDQIELWNISPLRKVRTLKHDEPTHGFSFSPDGSRLASHSSDRVVLWDVASGVEITRSHLQTFGEGGPLSRPHFSPDGTAFTWVEHSSTDERRIWDVSVSAPPSLEEAVRITGCRLDGFRVEPDVPRPEAGAPVSAAGAGPDGRGRATPSWSRLRPNRYWLGAGEGDAESLYRLAVIRERQHRDAEARSLHARAAAAVDPADREWAEKSRSRLKLMPWLQDWFPVFRRVEDLFTAGDDDGGLEAFREHKTLGTRDRAQAGRELVLRRAMTATNHFGAGEYVEAERQWRIAVQLDPDALNERWPDWVGLRLVGHAIEPLLAGDYDSWLARYEQARTSLPGLDQADPQSLPRQVLNVMARLGSNPCLRERPKRQEAVQVLKVATEFALASAPDAAPAARRELADAWDDLASRLYRSCVGASESANTEKMAAAEWILQAVRDVTQPPAIAEEKREGIADARAQEMRFRDARIYCLRRIAQLSPGNAGTHKQIAETYIRTGRFEEAVAELRRTIEMRGTVVGVQAEAALVHLLQGDVEKAAAGYARALQSGLSVDYVQHRVDGLVDSLSKGDRLRGDRYIIAFLCDWLAGRRPEEAGMFKKVARLQYKAYIDEAGEGKLVEAAKKRLAELAEEETDQEK